MSNDNKHNLIRAGSLNKDQHGELVDYKGSMAEAIENALASEWGKVKDTPMPQTDPTDRRLLFVAIAQGVVNHLRDHCGAFVVGEMSVKQKNENNIEVVYDSPSNSYGQKAGDQNRVLSKSSLGQITQIKTA